MASNSPPPVVVGVDGSPSSLGALDYAADRAVRRQTSLRIVRQVPLTVAHVHERDGPAAKQLLIGAVGPWANDYPGKPIDLRPVHSQHHPQYALLEASRNAAPTVVGARGHSGLASLLLGSVSRYLIHNAYGPVAVIHLAEHRKGKK